MENSIIDHVTNNATGININEKQSSLKLIDSFIVWIVIQCQLEIIASCPEQMNIRAGIKLKKKEQEVMVFTQLGYETCFCVLGIVIRIGRISVINDRIIEIENRFITFIWSCTNFLVPKTNG